MSTPQTTPEVTWAQRSSDSEPERNYVYLTLMTPDVSKSSMELQLTSTGLTFTGYSDTKKTNYHVELEFYGEIDVENSKTNHTARDVELILRKKDLKEEYWPRLLKDSKKMHFLKTDFDKWVDEDEQDGAPDEDAMGAGGMGGGGMPGMEGMGGMGGMGGGDGGFGGIDFSKLGAGAGGMGGMEGLQNMMGGMGGGMPDMSAMGAGDEGDEDDMPELENEGDDGSKASGIEDVTDSASGSTKVEEVS